jgi:regulatory protein
LKEPLTERYLDIGALLDRADIDKLETEIALSAGIAYAYRLLSVRDRTEREIRDALKGEGAIAPPVIDEIVVSLKRHGYLDDRRLASGYIRFVLEHRPSGPHLLRRKLRQAGVDEDIVEDELAKAISPDLERRAAERLARIKLRGEASKERGVRRVHGFLSRRGFSSSLVNDICARIMRGEIPGEEHE